MSARTQPRYSMYICIGVPHMSNCVRMHIYMYGCICVHKHTYIHSSTHEHKHGSYALGIIHLAIYLFPLVVPANEIKTSVRMHVCMHICTTYIAT